MSQIKFKVIENNNNMDKENKNKSLEAAVGLIEKTYGKGSIMKLGSKTNIDIESISTGSIILSIDSKPIYKATKPNTMADAKPPRAMTWSFFFLTLDSVRT